MTFWTAIYHLCNKHLVDTFLLNHRIDRDEKKWMVVNIQCHEDFSSQMLNRDTWTDDTVISLLRTSFVFWQRGHTSGDAQVMHVIKRHL